MRYGGNTACVSVDLGHNTLLVLDAGTGIRALGEDLAARDSDIFVRPQATAERIASATRTTCTISRTRWARTMCAPARTAAVTAAALGQSRSSGVQRARRGGEERLA